MAGLNKNRKPVAGLTTKNCQLISGRGTRHYAKPMLAVRPF